MSDYAHDSSKRRAVLRRAPLERSRRGTGTVQPSFSPAIAPMRAGSAYSAAAARLLVAVRRRRRRRPTRHARRDVSREARPRARPIALATRCPVRRHRGARRCGSRSPCRSRPLRRAGANSRSRARSACPIVWPKLRILRSPVSRSSRRTTSALISMLRATRSSITAPATSIVVDSRGDRGDAVEVARRRR